VKVESKAETKIEDIKEEDSLKDHLMEHHSNSCYRMSKFSQGQSS